MSEIRTTFVQPRIADLEESYGDHYGDPESTHFTEDIFSAVPILSSRQRWSQRELGTSVIYRQWNMLVHFQVG